jgi:hypothetical protein
MAIAISTIAALRSHRLCSYFQNMYLSPEHVVTLKQYKDLLLLTSKHHHLPPIAGMALRLS